MIESIDIPMAIAGVSLCLFGWLLYWVGLHAIGAVIGAFIGAMTGLGVAVALEDQGEWTLTFMAVGGLICAAFGFYLIKTLHGIAFFILGGVGGVAGAWITWPAALEAIEPLKDSDETRAIYFGLWLLVGGVLFAAFSRHIIMITTSLTGALLIVLSLVPPEEAEGVKELAAEGAGRTGVEAFGGLAGLAFIPILVLSLLLQNFFSSRFAAKNPPPRHTRDYAPDPYGGRR